MLSFGYVTFPSNYESRVTSISINFGASTGGPGGDFSRSRNSKFTGIIKLKLICLVPVFISLLLSQFQRTPLDITLPVGKSQLSGKRINGVLEC